MDPIRHKIEDLDRHDWPTEDNFTAPHAACMNPSNWHAPDGDSTEAEVTELVGALVRAIQPSLVVETGTGFGFTAQCIGNALRANGHGRLVTLETDHERASFAARLCEGLPVEVREESSLDYRPSQPIQFAWFDSLYELRALEFRRYHRHMAAGTIVAFHDWTSGLRGQYMDFKEEVLKLARDGLLTPIFVPTPRGIVIAEVAGPAGSR